MTETSATGQPAGDPAESGTQDDRDDPESDPDHAGPAAGDGAAGSARSGPAASAVLPATPGSVHAARAWVRGNLERSHVDAEVLARAELLVSEIATNAVQHTTSALFALRLVTGPALEISVHDQDPSGTPSRVHPTPDEDCGRGLAIVEALSQAWGIRRSPTGKTVWFRLDPDPVPGPAPVPDVGPGTDHWQPTGEGPS
jgi:anti-sigma regulatory factor (Ser/Thr protein kinase)